VTLQTAIAQAWKEEPQASRFRICLLAGMLMRAVKAQPPHSEVRRTDNPTHVPALVVRHQDCSEELLAVLEEHGVTHKASAPK
jgi:hypothetical protein